MRSFREWIAEDPRRRQSPWLILGKGPSFGRLPQLDSTGFMRFGLNHVVRETRVDVFHCIDIEVVAHCSEAIIENADVALLPWAPHVRRRLVPLSSYREFLPSGLSLADYLERYPVLRRLDDQGRLLWYNLRTAPRRLRRPEAPVTPARGFSASAATALLADAGVRHIRTLGIDGGHSYAGDFRDLADKTLLAAGQTSFDSQFEAIAQLVRTRQLDFGPLDHPVPARIRIAADATEQIPAKVLAHRLRRHASVSLSISIEPVGSAREDDRPEILLSASCLTDEDIRDTWIGVAGGGGTLLAAHGSFLQPPGTVCWPAPGPRPWLHSDAPDARRWCSALFDAVDDGAITREELLSAIQAGNLRHSLLRQLELGLRDPILLPRRPWVGDRFPGGAGSSPVRRRRLSAVGGATLRLLGEMIDWPRRRRYVRIALDKGVKILAGFFRQ